MYKLNLSDLYPAFIKSNKFTESVENIPDESVRKAVMESGIGDNLDRSPYGKVIYDFESGGLIEAEVQDALSVLDEEDYRDNYQAIGKVAETYAEWAVAVEEKIDRIFQLEDQLETLAEIDKSAQEYHQALLGYAQKMGCTLA